MHNIKMPTTEWTKIYCKIYEDLNFWTLSICSNIDQFIFNCSYVGFQILLLDD